MNDKSLKYGVIRLDNEVVGISRYPEKFAVRARGLLGTNPNRIIVGFDLEEIPETEYTTLEEFEVPILEIDEDGHIDLSTVLDKDVIARYEEIFICLEKLIENIQ